MEQAMEAALALYIPFSFTLRRPSWHLVAPIRRSARHWASRLRLAAIAVASRRPAKPAAPAVAMIDIALIYDAEWWNLFCKAKEEYDRMRCPATKRHDPCLPAVRWDGSSMDDSQRPAPRK
jgi:hypothetical protein